MFSKLRHIFIHTFQSLFWINNLKFSEINEICWSCCLFCAMCSQILNSLHVFSVDGCLITLQIFLIRVKTGAEIWFMFPDYYVTHNKWKKISCLYCKLMKPQCLWKSQEIEDLYSLKWHIVLISQKVLVGIGIVRPVRSFVPETNIRIS